MSGSYKHAIGGRLKLKKQGSGKKKTEKAPQKKKAKKRRKRPEELVDDRGAGAAAGGGKQDAGLAEQTGKKGKFDPMSLMTKAEKKAELARRKREKEEFKKLATKSHRERIDDMNQMLAKLPVHNDVPKIAAAGLG